MDAYLWPLVSCCLYDHHHAAVTVYDNIDASILEQLKGWHFVAITIILVS